MAETIITTIIQIVVGGLIGYFIAKFKVLKAIKQGLMVLLQTNLTTIYYMYEPKKKIPDYIYKNWIASFDIYESLGGDGYIHSLAEKMKDWDFIKTDILD